MLFFKMEISASETESTYYYLETVWIVVRVVGEIILGWVYISVIFLIVDSVWVFLFVL